MSNQSQASGGIGLFGVLGVAFIVLKLCGVINWSWLWVLAPFWMPLTIVLCIVAFAALIAVVVHWLAD